MIALQRPHQAPVPPPAPEPAPMPEAFASLAPESFRWETRGADSGVSGTDLLFYPSEQHRLVGARAAVRLPRAFTLRFRLRYEVAPGQEPWIILQFGERQALWLFPESDHVAALMARDGGAGWGIRVKQPMAAGRPEPDKWAEMEVQRGDRLRLRIDGAICFDHPIEESAPEEWKLIVGGTWREARIRDVRLRDDPKQ
jgi:hypothetical protein